MKKQIPDSCSMLPIASVMAIKLLHVTDTDVVVIAIAVTNVLRDCEIWIAFGHGAEQRYIPCHAIAAELGKGRTHRGVHFSFTRCQDVIRFLPSIIPWSWEENSMCCLDQYAYCHTDFCSVVRSVKPGIPPRLRANRKICCWKGQFIKQGTSGDSHLL